MLQCVMNQLGAVVNRQRLHHLIFVRFDRAGGDIKLRRDFLGRKAFGQQLKNLALSRRQCRLRIAGLVAALLHFVEYSGGDGRGQINLALQRRPDGGEQFLRRRMLEHESGGTRIKRPAGECRLPMHLMLMNADD